ncbi:MAG: PTS sugar transporter subunit IIA [bacterium]
MENKKVMTTRELAEYIQLNEKTVIKMAQNGELPGKKIGNQWRFHLIAIDNYLQENIMKSSTNDLDPIIRSTDEIIPLSRLTKLSLINLNLHSKDRDNALREMATIAYSVRITPSVEKLYEELVKREEMLSTAVGDSIALPHPRHPSRALFKKPHIIICRSTRGVQFFAPDNKKVNLFFLICAPDVCIHLRLLAKISQLLRIKDVIDKLMSINSNEDVIKILLEYEREDIYSIKR